MLMKLPMLLEPGAWKATHAAVGHFCMGVYKSIHIWKLDGQRDELW